MKCDRDCFNCKYSDCMVNQITTEEKLEIKKRDLLMESTPCMARGKTLRKKRSNNF